MPFAMFDADCFNHVRQSFVTSWAYTLHCFGISRSGMYWRFNSRLVSIEALQETYAGSLLEVWLVRSHIKQTVYRDEESSARNVACHH
jgi:hypothetical protein